MTWRSSQSGEGRNLDMILSVKTKTQMLEKIKQHEVLDCTNHKDKNLYCKQIQERKILSQKKNSLRSEKDDGLSSCAIFREKPTPDELNMDT